MLSFLDFQAVRWTIDGEVPGPIGNHHPTSTPMGMFRAADGWLNIAAPSDRLFGRMCSAIGAGHMPSQDEFATSSARHRNRDRLILELETIFAGRTRAEWLDILDQASVPCGPVNTLAETFEDPQVEHLAMTEHVEHPLRGKVEVLRSPITMSRTPRTPKTPSPLPGQHTDEILTELGYAADAIAEMHAKHVV